MDSKGLHDRLYDYQREIAYFSQLQTCSANPYEKNYYQNLMQNSTENLAADLEVLITQSVPPAYEDGEFVNGYILQNPNAQEVQQQPDSQTDMPQTQEPEGRTFTISELAAFDGSGGNPAYVAVSGKVYDVSDKTAWAGGMHFAGLRAGNDLTGHFMSCHRGMAAMLEQLPVVGNLVGEGE